MLRISYCPDNRLTVNCEILEREREREFKGVGRVVIDTTKFWGRGVGNINCCLEGSQALPASPSDRVEFEFSVKYSDLMW
jgi:hypothetical protein